MFLFFHKDQDATNYRYYKGLLFEDLLKQLFERLGYQIEVRKKKNSLEYDIEGKNIITSEKLIAEAKAHENTIPGKEVAAFVGKLIPLGIFEKKVHGLFMSLSSFSPDAEDYFSSVKNLNIKEFSGNHLSVLIADKLGFPQTSVLEKNLPDIYSRVADYILVADSGLFKVLVCRSNGNATPNAYAVFDMRGQPVTDGAFLKRLREQVVDLQELVSIGTKSSTSPQEGRIIATGLQLSTDWTDYKLPAAPKFFIGRTETIKLIDDEIAKTSSPLIQIKSRSGVGKSSLLAYLADKYRKQNHDVELHDTRDIKSILDIYILVQRFTGESEIAKDFQDVNTQIKRYAKKLEKKALFFVDQFESSFNRRDIFDSYESLFSLFGQVSDKIVVILGRKNDQLTTFDETEISLDKINSNSKSITLKDFEKTEAVDLIKKIIDAWGSNIDRELLSYVLEFSQGFPWLIKRTMAHILKQLDAGISQGDLIATGLRLDDLFNEELEGLDEVQLDYLTRIIQTLPASYHQLHKIFDEDPLLTKMLDHLTKTRLIRLSGSTYDTYNDVLKEYVLYKKLPQFKQKVLHRISANAVIRNFLKIYAHKSFDIDLVQTESGTTKGSAFNLVREWKALNLVESVEAGWKVPQIVLDILSQGRLGDYLRREIAKNDAAANILNLVTQGVVVKVDSIPTFLEKEFPFVEASDDTWATYSKALLSWMQVLMLVNIDKATGRLSTPSDSRENIINSLGNLSNLTGGRRGKLGFFMPNTRFSLALDVVRTFSKSGGLDAKRLNSNEKKGYSDLKLGGWIEDNQLLVEDEDEFINDARVFFKENYESFWNTALNGGELIDEMKRILPSLSTEVSATYAAKVLLSWGKGLGVIEDKRYKYTSKKKAKVAKKSRKKVVKKSKKK